MSDSVRKLARLYEENVRYGEHSRSIGLFPIPEYPEDEANQGMWSEALDAILTTLRYLAPATILTLFWGQQSFLFKLLKHIDSAFRAIVFSSEEQKQAVLQWLAETGPVQVEHLDTVWRHGWILCGVLDAALPGACAGHPPTRLSLKHAQTIADHYLGVEPVFSRQELEENGSLSKHQEWKLSTYLNRIREALSKLTPPVSRPISQRTSPEITQFTLDYVAKGSGLSAAQVHNKMYFKIYPTSQQSLDPGEITILIRGPKDTYGMTVIPPVLGKAQMIRQKLLGLDSKTNYTENALPITQGATYLRSYGKNDMNKTYYIPKSKYDIEIDEEIREDHARIGYVVYIVGKHEISITSRGQNIVGSPFTMTASQNIIGILENESFCLEDGEEIDIVDVQTDRKVVLRIVDFVTEKMLLKENGSLEKITDDQAKILMSTKNTSQETTDCNLKTWETMISANITEENKAKSLKFKLAANKVLKMNRICKVINDLRSDKQSPAVQNENNYFSPRSHQQTIPDIVNSTFTETNHNPFILPDKRDKFIIPESISVSIRTEKSKLCYKEDIKNDHEYDVASPIESNSPDSLEIYESLNEQTIEDSLVSFDRSSTSSNPFLNDIIDLEKDLGSFVKTEYETNNFQNEVTDSPIKIMVEEDVSTAPSPINKNPFIDPEVINLERPKTPILKIISGEITNRDESVYIDPKTARLIPKEILGNEFVNPFFVHHLQSKENVDRIPVADFIIGAPVSLPPIIRSLTPEPDMTSIIITDNSGNTKDLDNTQENNPDEVSSSVFSTPIHTNASVITTFHSLDSNVSDNVEILSLSNASDNQEPYQAEALQSDRNLTPKKDMWDSAYVSIDDNNSSPDSNNNDNLSVCETPSKQKFSPSDYNHDFRNMGPAEREIWQTCMELKHDTPKPRSEDVKSSKPEIKRPIFTPIIEESDRSISSGLKDTTSIKHTETDPVTMAFSELNDIYHDYFPTSESSLTTTINDDSQEFIRRGLNHTIEGSDDCVDSASEISDVKRHAEKIEGKISEVQPNVTESISVSQSLHDDIKTKMPPENYDSVERTEFGESKYTNIVLEKKQYWDERIREIQAKAEENKTQQKKRRLSSRHLRHNDSLTKKRGKQIVKNFLSSSEQYQVTNANPVKSVKQETVNSESPTSPVPIENVQTDTKLVEKWKKYWDSKLETEKDENDTSCFRTKSPKNKEYSVSPLQHKHIDDDTIEVYKETKTNKSKSQTSLPVKQELPEEVFKAFETSPKRFFGTSRKQILNKIDTFLGKPSTADESSTDVSGASHDTGLVSSRISLFHNISQTDDLPYTRRKCQSMQNIFQRKDSVRSTTSVDEKTIDSKIREFTEVDNHIQNNIDKSKENIIHDEISDIECNLEKQPINISLKDKRSRLVQKVNNKTFDETVYKKPSMHYEGQAKSIQTVINKYNKQDENNQKYKSRQILKKSSVSKSEMDIFNKTSIKPCEDDLDKYKSYDELPKINVKSFISLYENVSNDTNSKPEIRASRANFTGLRNHSQNSSSSGAEHNRSQYNSSVEISTSENYTESNTDLITKSKNSWENRSHESVSNNSLEPRSIDSVEVVPNPDVEKDTTYLSLSDIELEIVENPDKLTESSPERDVETADIDYKSRFKMAKQFFQSLEELREVKKPRKLNECELLLDNKSTESLETARPQKRTKMNRKAHSMPSGEIAKIWNQLQESQNSSNTKLVKISEKFNVDDLFNDVMEGKLSRQGSLRGIPHKKAVLEAFKSMENLADTKISSYEMAVTQLHDFAKENHIKNAQTYLSEYPYLPMTDPSKYHSRLDAKASGLISLKELINQKPRRNSVPDLRLNTKFTEDL